VFPGDVIVGRRGRVIVVPANIAAEIANEATAMTAYEDLLSI